MKQVISVLLFLFLSSNISSQIVDHQDYHHRLYQLCKVWGYVHYFHPNVQQCKVDWEESLLEYIPQIKESNADINNQLLYKMVKEAGQFPLANKLSNHQHTEELDWIKNQNFKNDLTLLLQEIAASQKTSQHCLVSPQTSIGNPIFHQNYYDLNEDTVEEEYRLLALFQYWNAIHYFYPYKELMDKDWDETLVEFIPRFVNATTPLEYHLCFKELTSCLNDAHAFFQSDIFETFKGNYYPPFSARYIEDQVVITNVFDPTTKLQIGDIIQSIDNYSIRELRDSLSPYIHASNKGSFNRNFIDHILANQYGNFEISIRNSQGLSTLDLTRNQTADELKSNSNSTAFYRKKVGDCQFAYVDMGNLENNMVDHLFSEVKEVDVLIFDLRNYPNATLWSIVNYLFDQPIHTANILTPDIKNPGTFFWKEEKIGQAGTSIFNGKLVLLMDERTQSQGEYTVMSLENYPNTLKIGSTTAGTNGDVSHLDLPGGIRTYFSGLGTYYSNYEVTQRKGIQADLEIKPSIEGIRNGRDEVLEAAFNYNYELSPDLCRPDKEVKLYPNPFRNQLNVEIKSPTLEVFDAEIVDVMGKRVRRFKVSSNGNYDEQLSDLTPGIYIIKLSSKDWSITKKVVKN